MAPAGREVDITGNEIPVPEAIVRAAGGEGVALLALPEGIERIFESLLPRFDLGKHVIEGIDEKASFPAGADFGADGVVLVCRNAAGDGGQLHQGISDGARKGQRNQECCTDREKEDKNGDLRIFEKPGAEPAQIEYERDGACAFTVEEDTAEKGEGLAIEIGSIAAQGGNRERRRAVGT